MFGFWLRSSEYFKNFKRFLNQKYLDCSKFSKFKGLLFGSGNGAGTGSESYRTDSSSPACASLSPPAKEESMEGHTSEEGDRDRILSPTRSPETPGFRSE